MAKRKRSNAADTEPRPWYRHVQSGRIDLRVTEVARERGIVLKAGAHKGKVNLSAISQATGISYTTLWDILRRPEDVRGISFDTLVALCVFLKCEPGDLLKVVPAKAVPQAPLEEQFKANPYFTPGEVSNTAGDTPAWMPDMDGGMRGW